MSDALLRVDDIHTYLGDSHIIQGVSLDVPAGKVVALLGRNGAGKTTTLRSIMRLVTPRRGARDLRGARHQPARDLRDRPRPHCLRAGDARDFSVALGRGKSCHCGTSDRGTAAGRCERIFDDFPSLAARRRNSGTQLSGGEQQMLAIARALVANPRLMLLDEPSEGLAPLIIRRIADMIDGLKRAGMTMLLVEQNFALATELADHIVVLGKGRVRWTGTSEELRTADKVRRTWLGV